MQGDHSKIGAVYIEEFEELLKLLGLPFAVLVFLVDVVSALELDRGNHLMNGVRGKCREGGSIDRSLGKGLRS